MILSAAMYFIMEGNCVAHVTLLLCYLVKQLIPCPKWLGEITFFAISTRRLYSVMRLGREALVRRWICMPLNKPIQLMWQRTPSLLDQLGLPA